MVQSYPNCTNPLSPTEQERLAEAVADLAQGIQFIDPNNNADGYAESLSEAVRSGRSYMVRARDDILVLDHDEDDLLVTRFADEFPSDFQVVITRSGQGSHQHGFVVIDDPAQRPYYERAAKDFGIADVQFGRWIRPPGAPHRFGGSWSRLENVDVDAAVTALYRPSGRTSPLGHKARQALYVGKTAFVTKHAPSGDASAALRSATLGMVNAGYSEDTMWALLMNNPGGEKIRLKIDKGMSHEAARRWWVKQHVETARAKVEQWPTVSCPQEALVLIHAVRAWSEAHVWKGVGGATDRSVLQVFLDLAEKQHRVFDLGLGCRDIADRAGLGGYGTASRSVKRLMRIGVLVFVDKYDRYDDGTYTGPRANRYALSAPSLMTEREQEAWTGALTDGAQQSQVEQSDSGGVGMTVSPVRTNGPLDHDAFRHRALGKSKLRVWEALNHEKACTTRELADMLGYTSTSTPRKHLTALANVGLAQETANGWIRTDANLDAIAQDLGTSGKGEAQRREHQEQRQRNRTKMAQRSEEQFAARHLRQGEIGDTISLGDLRREYTAFCFARGLQTNPARDRDLIAAIERDIRDVTFHEHGSSTFRTSGTLHGVRIINSPFAAHRAPSIDDEEMLEIWQSHLAHSA